MNKVLIIDDDKELCALMKKCIEQEKLSAVTVYNGIEGVRLIDENKDSYSLIILDVMLPDIDGFQILQKIRDTSNIPVLMLTAKSSEEDKVFGLRLGADDYLTKPFSVEELTARLRATLRRLQYLSASTEAENAIFTNGGLTIDFAAGCASLDGNELHLTPFEYKLLCLLARHVGKVLTHSFITKEIWGSSWEGDVASLRVFMASLRKKIEADPSQPRYIQTHVGVGYRMIRVE